MTPTTALIDGDHVAWHVSLYGPPDPALAGHYVRRLMREAGAGRAIVCMGDPSRRYFRHDWFPAYKAKRGEQPNGIDGVRDYLRRHCLARELPGLEADDVIGILATHERLEGHVVIVADDKDLLQIPGQHYNPRTRHRAIVGPREADRRHLLQALTGDGGDGYGGCPGVGAVRAARILDRGAGTPWQRVVLAFAAKGLTEADALLQARLARVLRAEDYDLTAKSVRPWTPQPREQHAHAQA